MTWPTASPVPSPSSPGTPLPPLVKTSALELGDIVGGAWTIYRARFGLFVKLLVMPFLISALVIIGYSVAVGAIVAGNPRGFQNGTLAGPLVVATVLFYLVMIALSLLVYVYQGRTVVAGLDLATGRNNPTSANLAERTTGLFGRLVMLVLLSLALGLAAGLVFALAVIPVAMTAGTAREPGPGIGLGTLILLMIVLYVGLIWLIIKLTYVIPVMAEERAGAWDSLKRSFQITKGAFWRTLGYQIVLGLIVGVIVMIPYFVVLFSASGLAATGRGDAVPAAAIAGIVIGLVLLFGIVILVVPYQYLYVALMYLGRTREQAGVPTQPMYFQQGGFTPGSSGSQA